MKKISLLRLLLLMITSSISITVRAQNTEVSGQIKGLSQPSVKIIYTADGVFKTDSATASGDNFTWKGNLDEPQLLSIIIGQNNYSFFAEPGHMQLTGVKGSSQSLKVTGSSMQNDAEAFAAFIKDLTDQQDLLYTGYNNASAEDKALVNKKSKELGIQRGKRTAQFITDHPKSFFSIYLISGRASFGTDYKEVKSLYDKLDASVKRTVSGKRLAVKLDQLKSSRIGTQIADFTQPDTSGKPVKISSFKGQYVLVDFWASWCAPCRAENPNILKVYTEYKDKGFTVVGISLDNKAANWKKAIRDDKMPWTELSDLKGWKNDLSASFGINSIPSNLLIDPSGKIIARDLRGPMLENKLKQILN